MCGCLLGILPGIVAAQAGELSLVMADIVAPEFSARGITLTLPMNGSADLQIASLKVQQREFRRVHVRCAEFTLSSEQVNCRNGSLDALPGAELAFGFDFSTRWLQLGLTAKGGESWQVTGDMGGRAWQLVAQLRAAKIERIAGFLPAGIPLPGEGALNGTLRVSGNASGMSAVSGDIRLAGLGFSDDSGLHAAEKLSGDVEFEAQRNAAVWNWQAGVVWRSGEMFWQPWYLRGGHTLAAAGSFDGKLLKVEQAQADLPEVGRVKISATWDVKQGKLLQGALRGDGLALEKLFELYIKPVLGKGTLADAAISGRADVAAQYDGGALQSLQLGLHDVALADATQRFALSGVNSEIDWRSDQPRTVQVAFAGGKMLGAALGAGQWAINMNGLDFAVPQAELAMLDGKLALRDLHVYRVKDDWLWQFAGALSPISMEQLSVAAGWPKMLGMLAGRIPKVSYDGNAISVEGALLFDVFDGSVVATQLKYANAFGRAPRLSGNLSMRNLDLDLLTRTFSFGNMQGRIDADVKDLQLQDWEPMRFDARVFSSEGRYTRKISQKAVQNISALGGAGAAAAIQRSFLGFFENFGYDRIGWSCVLRNGVCTMGGIGEATTGTYTLIKGGGIPAINVMGYNRNVSWRELVTRLKRVTQKNSKPVVR